MILNDKSTRCVYNVYIYLSRGPAFKCLHCVDWRFRSIIISRGFQQKHWDRCDLSENWPALDIFLTKFVIILFGFWNLPDYLNNCGCEGQSRQNVEGWDEHVEPLVCMQVYHFLWVSMYYNGIMETINQELYFRRQKNYWISTKSLIKREQPTHFRHHQICLVSCPQVQWLLRWWNKNKTHRRMTWSFFLKISFTIASVFFTYHSS